MSLRGLTGHRSSSRTRAKVKLDSKMPTDFEPIDHKNLDFLSRSLKEARTNIKDIDVQKKISAVLWLANHVEYLTKDLIRNLRRLIKISSYKKFNGTFFWPFQPEEENLKKMTLGNLINELGRFNFPDRMAILDLLNRFNDNRIKLIHKLLDEPPDENLISSIIEDFDNIFARYLTIQEEMKKSWP